MIGRIVTAGALVVLASCGDGSTDLTAEQAWCLGWIDEVSAGQGDDIELSEAWARPELERCLTEQWASTDRGRGRLEATTVDAAYCEGRGEIPFGRSQDRVLQEIAECEESGGIGDSEWRSVAEDVYG